MAEESKVNRRDFVKSGATAAALTGVTFITKPERVFGADDRVRVAVVGVRGRGGNHIDAFDKLPNVEVAALCDPDANVLASRLKYMEGKGYPKPQTHENMKDALADKN